MMKRLFDITFSGIGLLLLSPVLAVVACLIWDFDGHSPFFTQERCGRGDSRFQIIKFRTMVNGNHQIKDYAQDGRVTSLGKYLRKYHIDEIPSLINVVKGDMSLVGPRPMPYEVDQELDPGYENTYQIPGWSVRSSVRPGMTGLAQVLCPKMASRRNKFRFDAVYVAHRSFEVDNAIIVITVGILIFPWEHIWGESR